MISPNIYYLCPDDPAPSGGVRTMYRHVDALNSGGIKAFVVHHRPEFRVGWFDHSTPVLHLPVDVKPGDVLVLPEIQGNAITGVLPGMPKVVFNQNAYFTFLKHSPDPADRRTPYTSPDVLAAIVISEDSRAYLSYTFPRLPVHRVRLGIDPAVHHPAPKKRQLCFMARKQVEDARQVLNILKHRGALTAYSAVPVQQMRHQEAAAILRESAVFLSFGHPEGFGLPAAEAMACGCVVVGYHGNGGREFFTPEHGFPIEAGDIIGFARTAEYVLTTLSRDSAAFNELTKSASEFIRSSYSLENERADILSCWRRIIGR